MIAVIHAYSRRNAGDGLLVDLTLEHLRRAGIRPEECEVFALDAPSFGDLPHVHQVGVPGRRPSPGMIPASGHLAASALAGASGGRVRVGRLADVLGRADAIVAVGGGYLRAGDVVSSAGSLLNHIPQLALASGSNAPTIYMPQSIGPLRGPVGRLIGRLLQGIEVLCVRDDRSREELLPRVAAERYPDLAVMHLAEELGAVGGRSKLGEAVVLVGRELKNGRSYEENLLALAGRLENVVWAAQAEGIGTKSDHSLYERLGVSGASRLVDVLDRGGAGVVVSTRLHGAVQALLTGIPAVHLSYERKGWGAYSDLGIDEFVHNARTFDPDKVAQQARGLLADPMEFWKRIEGRRPALVQASGRLTRTLQEQLA